MGSVPLFLRFSLGKLFPQLFGELSPQLLGKLLGQHFPKLPSLLPGHERNRAA